MGRLDNMMKIAHKNGWIRGSNVAKEHYERVEVTHLALCFKLKFFEGCFRSREMLYKDVMKILMNK